MKLIKIIFITLFIFNIASAQENKLVKLAPESFDYGIQVNVDKKDTGYYLKVPNHVYENVKDKNLTDLVIFNAKGEVIPFTLRRPLKIRYKIMPDAAVSFYKLKQDIPDNQTKMQELVADISTISTPIKSIVFDFKKNQTFNAIVDVYASGGELNRWSNNGGYYSIAYLKAAQDSSEVVKNTIVIPQPPSGTKYLKFTISPPYVADMIEKITFTFDKKAIESVSEVMTAQGIYIDNETGGIKYEFDIKGVYPIDWLHIKVPESYLFPDYSIYVKDLTANTWKHHTRVTTATGKMPNNQADFYNLSRYRYWLINITNNPDGGIAADFYWKADELVFIAQGEGPYTIAYGNDNFTPTTAINNSKSALLTSSNNDEPEITNIGSPTFYGGGKKIEQVEIKKKDYTFILYGIIVLVVLFLSFSAFRLLMDVNRKNKKEKPLAVIKDSTEEQKPQQSEDSEQETKKDDTLTDNDSDKDA